MLVARLHLGSDACRLQLAGNHPAADFIEQESLDTAVKGVEPALVVGRGCPDGDDVVAVFVEMEVETDGIVRGATDAVVAFGSKPGVKDAFHGVGLVDGIFQRGMGVKKVDEFHTGVDVVLSGSEEDVARFFHVEKVEEECGLAWVLLHDGRQFVG